MTENDQDLAPPEHDYGFGSHAETVNPHVDNPTAPRFRTCQVCGGAGYFSCHGPCGGIDDLGCDVCEGALYIDCDNCEATGLLDNEEYGDDV